MRGRTASRLNAQLVECRRMSRIANARAWCSDIAAAGALEGTMASGDIIRLSPGLPGLTFTTAGNVLSSAHIYPVFWGPYWASDTPPLTRAQILSAMQSIVDG